MSESVPNTSENTSNPRAMLSLSLGSARVLLVLCALVSCGPPLLHQRLIEPHLDAVRYPFPPHFLPSEFLMLRHFGHLAECFPVFFVALFFWSFVQSASLRRPLFFCSAIFLLFLFALSQIGREELRVGARRVATREEKIRAHMGSFGWEGTLAEYAKRLVEDDDEGPQSVS